MALLWGSSTPYWVESFRGMQSLPALQLPSAGRSPFLLESQWALQISVRRGYIGVFQNQCFWLWSPAGSQAIVRVVWPISALDFGWLMIPCFGSVGGGSQPLIRLRNHPRFQVWAPSQGFRCACPPCRFLSVPPGSQAAYQGTRPPGVSGVGPRPLIGVSAHWGTLGLGPRQPGRLSGHALTRSFSCGPPVS